METTPTNNTNSHIPGVYQGSPDAPKVVVELSPIRTMRGDIALASKNQNETLVSISIAENKKKDAERAMKASENTTDSVVGAQTRSAERVPVSTAPRPIGRIIIVVVIILVLVGIGLAFTFILPKLSIPSFGSPSTDPTPGAPTDFRVELAPSLIKATSEKRFFVNNESTERMFADVANARTAFGAQGDIKNFYFHEEVSTADGSRQTDLRDTIPQNRRAVSISANKLLMLTKISAPEILTRSLENIFMAGLLNEETGSLPTPFIILKVSGYDTGYAGMLEWERSLPRFFDIVFGTNIEAGLSDTIKMRDVVISGEDARVLEITPTVGIAYSFANPSTVVITMSRNALEKLIPMVPPK